MDAPVVLPINLFTNKSLHVYKVINSIQKYSINSIECKFGIQNDPWNAVPQFFEVPAGETET